MKKSLFLSMMMLIAIAFPLFTACGDDEEEPSIDELLSEETTPIDFEIEDFNRYNSYDLFDYAGSKYIGTENVSKSPCTIDLRQGKHHLIWLRGLQNGIKYDPNSRTLTLDTVRFWGGVSFFEKDIEVTPYLMPVQKVKFENPTVAYLRIEVTDGKNNSSKWDEEDPLDFIKITGLPYVKTVSLKGDSYKLENEKISLTASSYSNGFFSFHFFTLCPLNGLVDIQLETDISDVNGNPIPTTKLPKFSLYRGKTTTLTGPLFSGSTSDWKVKIER